MNSLISVFLRINLQMLRLSWSGTDRGFCCTFYTVLVVSCDGTGNHTSLPQEPFTTSMWLPLPP